jgi:hypothetical protein
MNKTVDFTIPVAPEVAAALAYARNREAVGRQPCGPSTLRSEPASPGPLPR